MPRTTTTTTHTNERHISPQVLQNQTKRGGLPTGGRSSRSDYLLRAKERLLRRCVDASRTALKSLSREEKPLQFSALGTSQVRTVRNPKHFRAVAEPGIAA